MEEVFVRQIISIVLEQLGIADGIHLRSGSPVRIGMDRGRKQGAVPGELRRQPLKGFLSASVIDVLKAFASVKRFLCYGLNGASDRQLIKLCAA